MNRTDIQVIVRKSSMTILTKKNQLTFPTSGQIISVFSTAKLTPAMLDELDSSKIIEVEGFSWDDESTTGSLRITKKDFFSNEKLIDIFIDIVEKHDF